MSPIQWPCCAPHLGLLYLCNPLTLVCYPKTARLHHFHIIHGLSLLLNKIFVTFSDLGVLLKDLCATSSLIFHISYSLTKYFCHHLTLVCSWETSVRPHQSGLLPAFQRHPRLLTSWCSLSSPWIFMVDRKFIELIFMRAKSKKLHQISAKKLLVSQFTEAPKG